MGEVVCHKCGAKVCVTPIKTRTLDDIEHLKIHEPGAYKPAREVLMQITALEAEVMGKMVLCFHRGRLQEKEDRANKKC